MVYPTDTWLWLFCKMKSNYRAFSFFFNFKQPKKAVFQNGPAWSSFLPNFAHILTAFWGKMCITVCVFYCYVLSSACRDTVMQSEEGASQKNKMKIQHLYWFHVQAALFILEKLHLFLFHFYTYTNLFISAVCHIFFSEIFFSLFIKFHRWNHTYLRVVWHA